jgi:hypothetical protein
VSEPKDYFGEALAAAIREGRENPELVAAMMAQISEAVEDTLALAAIDRVKFKASIDSFLADLKLRGHF